MNGGYWECPKSEVVDNNKVYISEKGLCIYCGNTLQLARIELGLEHCIDCASSWISDRRSNMVLVLNHKSAYHPMFLDDAHIARNARR